MGLSYHYAGATTPVWLELLLYATPAILLFAAFLMVFSSKTRGDALLLLLSVAAIMLGMQWIYVVDGYTRLLAAPQAIIWTLLALHLHRRVGDVAVKLPQRVAIFALLGLFAVNLALDYTELVKYASGDRLPPAYVSPSKDFATSLPYSAPLPARPASYW